MDRSITLIGVLSFMLIVCHPNARAETYDPLTTKSNIETTPSDSVVKDMDRDREIPIRVFLPESKDPASVVLFSHGLGGSRRAGGYLGKHWSQRGYAVVVMQHAGSDESVWKDQPLLQRMNAMRAAASAKNTFARFGDVKAVLNQLEKWNSLQEHPFHGRFDLEKIGMSGHSYGAATTQGVSGQTAGFLGQRYTDQRIDAALMLSPNRPRKGDVNKAFGSVSIPWMLMTGTQDTSPINDTTVDDRRQVYPALPNTVDKYELVLHDAQHHAFGEDQQGRRRQRNPNHHRVILALSTAFWDAHLSDVAEAKSWLHGEAAKEVLEPNDVWQFELAKTR
ncbi:MAG: dienelactone hydrolase [Planctomycetota bacterium]